MIDFLATKDADNKLEGEVSGKSLEPSNTQRQLALNIGIKWIAARTRVALNVGNVAKL